MDFSNSFYTNGIAAHHSLSEHPDASIFERHCHPCYELIFVVKGKGKYIAESNEYELLPNTIILLRPFEYHYVKIEPSHPYERFVINFEKDCIQDFHLIEDLLSTSKEGHGKYFPTKQISRAILSAFSIFDELLAVKDDLSGTLLKSTLSQILFLISRQAPQTIAEGTKKQISEIIEYLNRHWSDRISLDDLAKRFFISKSYLCRAFHKQTGVSVIAYLNTKRIAFAQEMIGRGEPATEVCYRVGFLDYSVFYRAYRKQTGHAPGQTRK